MVEMLYGLPHIKIKEIMVPSNKVVTAKKEETLEELVTKFIKHGFHALPVVEERKIIGVVTKSDLLKVIGDRKIRNIFATHVSDIMSPHPITISPEAYLSEAANLMYKNKIRFLPVVNENKEIEGVVSYSDLIMRIFKKIQK